MSTPYTMQKLRELAGDGIDLLELDDPDLLATIAERDDLRAQLEAVTRERDSWRSQRDEVHAEMERQAQLKREERQAKLDAQRERDEARREAAVVLGVPAETCAKHGATTVATKAGQRWRVACAQCQDDALTTAERERDEAIERAHRSGLLFDDARKQTTEARADAARLREALKDAVDLISHGDFRNGNEHAGVDEGEVLTGRWIARFRATLASAPSAEPTPRDMRVAEAVRGEASDMVRDADDGVPLDCLADSIDAIDLAAVVAKAVKP